MTISARGIPLDELEDAHEHAEILLTRYASMLSEQLSALLSAWHTDLTEVIEDRYDPVPDEDEGLDGVAV